MSTVIHLHLLRCRSLSSGAPDSVHNLCRCLLLPQASPARNKRQNKDIIRISRYHEDERTAFNCFQHFKNQYLEVRIHTLSLIQASTLSHSSLNLRMSLASSRPRPLLEEAFRSSFHLRTRSLVCCCISGEASCRLLISSSPFCWNENQKHVYNPSSDAAGNTNCERAFFVPSFLTSLTSLMREALAMISASKAWCFCSFRILSYRSETSLNDSWLAVFNLSSIHPSAWPGID